MRGNPHWSKDEDQPLSQNQQFDFRLAAIAWELRTANLLSLADNVARTADLFEDYEKASRLQREAARRMGE